MVKIEPVIKQYYRTGQKRRGQTMRLSVKFIASILLCLLPLRAAVSQWVSCNLTSFNTVTEFVSDGVNIIAIKSNGDHIYRSADNGLHWMEITEKFEIGSVNAIVLSSSKAFAATRFGEIYASLDGGIDWHETNPGVSYFNSTVKFLAIVDNGNGGINLLAGTSEEGIRISTDKGVTWGVSQTEITDPDIRAIVVDSTDIYAGTYKAGVFRSTDNGMLWTPASDGLPQLSNLSKDYAAIYTIKIHGAYVFAATSQGLYRSEDQGLHWKVASTDLDASNDPIFNLLSKNGNLYGLTVNKGNLLISMDDGMTWSDYSVGLTSNILNCLTATDEYLFVAGADVWRRPLTIGGSEEWTFIMDSKSTNQGWLKFTKLVNGKIEANGQWTYLYNGSPIQGNISGLATTSGDNALVIDVQGMAKANAYTYATFTETMNGDLNKFQSSGTYDIRFTEFGWPSLLHGTYSATKTKGAGIITGVEFTDETIPWAFSLSQNYPNPFNPSTTIEYVLPYPAKVTINIFNMLGQEVFGLVNEEESAGNRSIVWTADVPGGLYFYQLNATSLTNPKNRFEQTKKMVLMK
jgi:hypothetical protein